MTAGFHHLMVVGFGLMGASLAKAARKAYPSLQIDAVDTDPDVLAQAKREGVADNVYHEIPQEVPEETLIVLACHISGCLSSLEELTLKVYGRDVVVTDISSCKRPICELGGKLLPDQFVGGHPMAGREVSGFSNAREDLFDGKLFLLCVPEECEDLGAMRRLEKFMQGIGMATRTIEPDVHDRVMAYVSHFPQLYALLITNLLHNKKDGADILACHGGALAEQLRLAASPFSMWGEVFKYNYDNLSTVLEEFASLLVKAGRRLDKPDMLEEWFSHANHVHDAFKESRARMAYDPFSASVPKDEQADWGNK